MSIWGGADLCFLSPDTSLYCETTDTGLVYRSVSVFVYVAAFTGTYCTYPQRDGQAKLSWGQLLYAH